MEIVYENGIFQGYGYVTRTLETADDQNRYVAGAEMALFEAIEVRPSGDTGDHRMEGVEIQRDRNGNVLDIQVKKGYAGSAFRLKRMTMAAGHYRRRSGMIPRYCSTIWGILRYWRQERMGSYTDLEEMGKK